MGLSGREAAKALGLTQPALVKAAKSGRVTREPDGSYDVDSVRRQLAENSNALKRRKSKKERSEVITGGDNHQQSVIGAITTPVTVPVAEFDDSGPLAEAQRREAWIKVLERDLKYRRQKAELAPIGEINAWVAGMIIRSREVLVRIAPELKDRLAQQTNPHECEKLVADEVQRALKELAEFRSSA